MLFENPFGPVHAYVAPADGVLALKLSVPPVHIGVLLPAVGATGVGLTVTVTVPAAEVHPLNVAVTLYSPLAATDAFGIVGFCTLLLKPFGPFQVYVTPGVAELAVSTKLFPLHIGLLLPVIGVAGGVGSDKVKGPTTFDGQPFSVTDILVYDPAARFGMVRLPPASDDIDAVCGVPFSVYETA